MGTLRMLLAIVVTASVTLVAEAMAQTQPPPPAGQRPPPAGAGRPPAGEETIVEGQIKSVDSSGTAITLTDGTRLAVPPGATLRPVVTPGATVVATYKEENGSKVLTALVVTEPLASPPAKPRPEAPSTAPPGTSPKY